ncbi:hypothetical protein KTE28_18435 [Burkholderia multivorans]|uniref:MazG nucleotide pyrophosphohydrolase domain-containing protein n=1 Tax=Burkholderia multivorans TaxID=87883 RepID=UPI001C26EB78|nr:MazG nucleotide pyrophosphohydrolase domain-containing protein [Burkholderia multivorans]MBU9376307.1 hypothetical protein [Burkholderia multivorans]MDN7597223.1 MazG nucleotide pyrophosphohydrolase domain-containing protein [Burkholderia multivorans]MDN7844492.1 MazG nucleotide pyrophosphohydrolase domain-containing protein [Burkholderia multivorans]HEF4776457.1 hypothetical protein [Burkholderia multivorans]HEF4823703.1 hypothetical protein [Burkholderia multivorans]
MGDKLRRRAALHLASECGELTQAIVKWLQDPSRLTRYNVEMEAGDVLALIDLLREQGVIRNEQVHDRQQEKLENYRRKYG